ncbi:MAG: TRAP transporter small permease [Bacteroidetes bacterium]|jgi:TRAP-type C4-dicarboxylate transport system permease small subunit|nr:TRAP transporter small permease [Bacteroidales bacterium]RLD48039.1 MAG: TRAP transporter small permease [Bacteroidota bacterium]RLD69714.1 MAG: TRAP transporter small permease [Bacteroidota bacterium]
MRQFQHILNKVLELSLVILMSVLVLDVLWQVFSRYLLSSPSSFTDELAGFLLIWVGVLGAAYVAGRKEHLAIDILIQRSPPARQRFLLYLIHSLIFLFALSVMVTGGFILVYSRFVLQVKSAALQLPLGFVYIVLPISGLIIMFYEVFHMLNLKRS